MEYIQIYTQANTKIYKNKNKIFKKKSPTDQIISAKAFP